MNGFLAELGHTVVGEAENGEQACELYATLKPDVVFMDITMPVLSGKDALIRIKHEDPACNVIMCSALGSEAMIAECIRFGARAYIVKPYTKEKLDETINKVLGIAK